ncbi:MAG: redoxin domain-containing protein, partial [Pirellulaceae bacterium]|nr:redoxin domain-containing protein [Pirellulaceae bacterium]
MNALRIVRHAALGTLLVASLLGEPARRPLAVEFASAQTPPGPVDVAPLPEGLDWLNTDRPLKLAAFRGKFVLLDFWTYCCINCMHILPELKQLERSYPNNLVVIGVHSAKFETEKDVENIREAIDRYEIEHPVVVDSELTAWQQFGARAWPTVILIDPRGKEILRYSGEITAKQIADVLDRILPIYRRNHLLDERPVQFARPEREPTALRFPGKVLADESGRRLFIADSNHNRIVVASTEGTLLETIGSGRAGRADGD